ncbi:hypothetical protein QM012_005503 [Aureobasidium pullulans]|uniref:Developmental regulatory protein wetA n=1 Tax=Aureobasidium pullulans TaxID=5580 RepID=A0ABR0T4J7_AURPU
MAYLAQYHTYPIRSTNKEPQWATVHDDLFSQYVDIDADDFKFGTSSSDEASNNENTEGHSTDSGDSSHSEAAARRLSDDFWARTLAVLEESASSLEQQQDGTQREESDQQTHHHDLSPAASFYHTKNTPHADFLSLGGFPSCHISTIPSSPSAEAAARRRRAIEYQQERSTRTPERPVGVTKAYRSSSKSPKMMTPSRYRAGAQDAWIGSIYQTPNRISSMNLPVGSMSLTPPSSGRSKPAVGLGFQGWNDIDASPFQPFSNHTGQTSHLPNPCNQQSLSRQLYSPETSPLTSPSVERGAIFAEDPTIFRDVYYEQASNTDCYNKSAWSANSFGAEDIYEPSLTFSPWLSSEMKEAEYQASLNNFHVHNSLLPATTYNDPTLAPTYAEEPVTGLDTAVQATSYYTTNAYPTTITRRESRTPSPPRNRIRKRNSSSKLHSRKSSSDHKTIRASKSGGFVNYTPSDSEKLLTGVAPSGSSKTKARREREAAERWRRFSQAAAKAVAEAGGALPEMAPVANMLPPHTDMVDTEAGGSFTRV